MNTITAQVVMLPTKDKTNLRPEEKGEGVIRLVWDIIPSTYIFAKYQHLYFTTDEPIQKGVWVFDGDSIFQCDYVDAFTKINGWKMVTASSDPALGLSAIPAAWIKDEYVPSNGSIKEVKLELITGYFILSTNNEPDKWVEFNKPKLRHINSEVVIVNEPKHTMSKHDAWNNAKLEGMEITHPTTYVYQSKKSKEILANTPVEVKEKVKNFMDKIDNDQELEDAANSHSEDWVYTEYGNDVRENLSARKEAFKEGFKAGTEWHKEQSFTLEQMFEAITYGFEYHRDSMHNDQDVPEGNKLQWILGKFRHPLTHPSIIDIWRKK